MPNLLNGCILSWENDDNKVRIELTDEHLKGYIIAVDRKVVADDIPLYFGKPVWIIYKGDKTMRVIGRYYEEKNTVEIDNLLNKF